MLRICPKCGKLVGYNSWFKAFYCRNCGELFNGALTIAYIEREAAIKALMNDAPEQVGYSREDAADCIRYMDAIDVVPVQHGRWVSVPHKLARVCSVCNRDEPYKFADIDADVYDYCPNCGAKMDGDAGNGC